MATKTYMQIEQRVALLEGILTQALANLSDDWKTKAVVALTPEPEVKVEGMCTCKHPHKTHASNSLCCFEGCECLKFSLR
jgi:hypothetical protein